MVEFIERSVCCDKIGSDWSKTSNEILNNETSVTETCMFPIQI